MELKEFFENCNCEIAPEGDFDFMAELKMAAWNILHENPGIDFGEWRDLLIEQYPTEIVDALGVYPVEVHSTLANWWTSEDFEDEDTGMCERFRDWAEIFATDRSVELYDMLAEARRKIKLLERDKNRKQ